MPKVQLPSFPERSISISEFGAVADGQTMNTRAFNDAISACAKAGGGHVIVPAGVWRTGPIRFESNIDLHLEKGAFVMFSGNRDDFPLMPYPSPSSKNFVCQSPIYGYKLENIAITGDGVFDGSGEAWRPRKKEKYTAGEWKRIIEGGGVLTSDGKIWWPSKQAMNGEEYLKAIRKEKKSLTIQDFAGARDFLRPHLLDFVGCRRVLIDGPTFSNSPKFAIHPLQCEDLVIRYVTVRNPWNAQNGDGIDIASCHSVVLYDCTVDAGDDGICLKPGTIEKRSDWAAACENIIIADCIVYRAHGGFVIGSETYGGARNVSVYNCTFDGTDVGLRFKSSRERGGIVENITIDGIRMKGIENEAILFDSYYEVSKPGPGEARTGAPVSERTPQFRKFTIRNVVCSGAARAISVQGLPELPVRDIEFENITISANEGISCIDADSLKFINVGTFIERGSVFNIDNAREISITHQTFNDNAELFMSIIGKESGNIRLTDTNIRKAKTGLRIGNDVSKDAVKMETGN